MPVGLLGFLAGGCGAGLPVLFSMTGNIFLCQTANCQRSFPMTGD